MHELSVIQHVLEITEQVARDHKLNRVNRISLVIGELQHLNDQILLHGFESARTNTVAGKARLHLSWLPVQLRCTTCNCIFGTGHGSYICPVCESSDAELIQGTDLYIETIEGD